MEIVLSGFCEEGLGGSIQRIYGPHSAFAIPKQFVAMTKVYG